MHTWHFINYKVVDNDTLNDNFYAAIKMDSFEEKGSDQIMQRGKKGDGLSMSD